MEMKWNPIIDGDLNGIPRDEGFFSRYSMRRTAKHMQPPVGLKKVSTEI